ncbi:MAG: acyl-CoA dehydrogenase family protein [Solirubrobacterales bacterium]|nr:acyl-CoA dehydrogenase family protein [Solirubrobacterales bacterium]
MSDQGVLRPDFVAAGAPIPPFTAEHEAFRVSARGWIEQELLPHADQWEEAKWFPNEMFGAMAEQGFIGLKFDPAYGGDGDEVAAAVLAMEMARCGSGGVAAGLGAHMEIALPPIAKFGTEDQKQRWLVPGIKGELIAALAITEPDAGSDVAGLRTTAKPVDGGWIVSGEKCYITGGCRADVLVTAVRMEGTTRHDGITFLVIERGEGLESSPLQKLGWHASDTALIKFDEVFVPEENLLGAEGQGFALIMANFQWERLTMSLGAIGGMEVCFEQTVKYAQEREAFGRPISKNQVIRHKFAEMATKIETGRALSMHALRMHVAGENAVKEVTMAKLFTQKAAFEVADECLQIHGGAGYMVEYGIERAARDARLGPIGGGTDEVMKEILGKMLGL